MSPCCHLFSSLQYSASQQLHTEQVAVASLRSLVAVDALTATTLKSTTPSAVALSKIFPLHTDWRFRKRRKKFFVCMCPPAFPGGVHQCCLEPPLAKWWCGERGVHKCFLHNSTGKGKSVGGHHFHRTTTFTLSQVRSSWVGVFGPRWKNSEFYQTR